MLEFTRAILPASKLQNLKDMVKDMNPLVNETLEDLCKLAQSQNEKRKLSSYASYYSESEPEGLYSSRHLSFKQEDTVSNDESDSSVAIPSEEESFISDSKSIMSDLSSRAEGELDLEFRAGTEFKNMLITNRNKTSGDKSYTPQELFSSSKTSAELPVASDNNLSVTTLKKVTSKQNKDKTTKASPEKKSLVDNDHEVGYFPNPKNNVTLDSPDSQIVNKSTGPILSNPHLDTIISNTSQEEHRDGNDHPSSNPVDNVVVLVNNNPENFHHRPAVQSISEDDQSDVIVVERVKRKGRATRVTIASPKKLTPVKQRRNNNKSSNEVADNRRFEAKLEERSTPAVDLPLNDGGNLTRKIGDTSDNRFDVIHEVTDEESRDKGEMDDHNKATDPYKDIAPKSNGSPPDIQSITTTIDVTTETPEKKEDEGNTDSPDCAVSILSEIGFQSPQYPEELANFHNHTVALRYIRFNHCTVYTSHLNRNSPNANLP